MKRSRLSEAQFLSIASGYINLFSAQELERFIKDNKDTLCEDLQEGVDTISRNTINQIYKKLDLRVSLLVEGGVLEDFPYKFSKDLDKKNKESQIILTIEELYLLLTNKTSIERFRELHDFWRRIGRGSFLESIIYIGVKKIWDKMSGVTKPSLRYLFNRVCFVCFFILKNQNSSKVEVSEIALEELLIHLVQHPLE